jgi:hypothetical protein
MKPETKMGMNQEMISLNILIKKLKIFYMNSWKKYEMYCLLPK